MDRIKGQIVEILAPDRVLVEIAFIGNYNRQGYPDFVPVRFTDLSPPYTKDVPESEIVSVLNQSILGAQVSVQAAPRSRMVRWWAGSSLRASASGASASLRRVSTPNTLLGTGVRRELESWFQPEIRPCINRLALPRYLLAWRIVLPAGSARHSPRLRVARPPQPRRHAFLPRVPRRSMFSESATLFVLLLVGLCAQGEVRCLLRSWNW